MALTLDARQRAILREMGVPVWLAGPATAHPENPAATPATPATSAIPSRPVRPIQAIQSNPPLRPAPVQVAARPVPLSPTVAKGAEAMTAAPPPVGQATGQAADWGALAQGVAACQACGLCAGRRNVVLSDAPLATQDWMVVGDPPDEDEERQGKPFAQAQGVLLDNMLAAVGASRQGQGAQGAYVTNVVKCRPPHGRQVAPEELAQCTAWLRNEVALVRPRMILAMGRIANQALLANLGTQALGRLRGSVYPFEGIPVLTTYAPKVLLRSSADKAKAWADLCLAKDILDKP